MAAVSTTISPPRGLKNAFNVLPSPPSMRNSRSSPPPRGVRLIEASWAGRSAAGSAARVPKAVTRKPRSGSRKARTACGSAAARTGLSIIQRPRSRRRVISPSARRTVNFSMSSATNSVSRGSRKEAAGAEASPTMVSGTRNTARCPSTPAKTSCGNAVPAPMSRPTSSVPRNSMRRRGGTSPASGKFPATRPVCRSCTSMKRAAMSRRSTASGEARSSAGATMRQPADSRRRLTVSSPRLMSISRISSGSKTAA